MKRLIAILFALAIVYISSTAFAAEWVAKISSSTKLYSSASASSKELGTVNSGTYVSLIESKNGWAKIKLNGQTRYVKSSHVSKTTKTMYIGNGFDTIYKSARSSSEKVTTAGYGADVQVRSIDGSWALVKVNGKEGYVRYSSLLSKNPNTLDQVMYAKEDDLPVYQLATSESTVLKTIRQNTKVTCVAKFGSSWYRVKLDGKYGYIRASKLSSAKSDTPSTPASNSSANHSSAVSKTMYIGNAYNTVYASARSTGEKVTVAGYGTEVTVKSVEGSWAFVKVSGKEGYVRYSALISKNPNTLSETMYAEEDDLPVYQLATSASTTLKTIKQNTKVTCVAKYGSSWYRVKVDGIYGYIRASKLAKSKTDASSTSSTSNSNSSSARSSAVSKTMYIGNAYNTVYSSARSTGEKVTVVGYGTEVTVKAIEGSWAFVKVSGKEGYVRYSALISKNPNTLSETMYAKEDDLPVYQLATSASTVLKNIDQNTRVTCVAKFDGTWYRVKVDGKYGYIRANKLDDSKQKADASDPGSASAVKPSGKVIEADWFNSDIQSVFSRGTIATVTDVRTGIKWDVYRSGGYNHADVQPRTASDTAAMKRATGSDFGTWNRRPIWVTIGSRTYAASMNCMPHGDGSITNNSFDGHYCIHFTRSRTHGTNRVCATHQSTIKEALRAAK